MARHGLSTEELETWTRNYRAYGKAGLQATRRHREDLMSLRLLYDEFCSLRLIYDDDDHWRRRISDIRRAINTTPPASVADCAVKLRAVLDPLGMAVGEDPDDLVALRQVAAFLEHYVRG